MSLTRTKIEESALSQYVSAREGIHFEHADAVVSDQQLDSEFEKMKRRQRREAQKSEQQTRSLNQNQGASRATASTPLHSAVQNQLSESLTHPEEDPCDSKPPQATKKNMLQDIMLRIKKLKEQQDNVEQLQEEQADLSAELTDRDREQRLMEIKRKYGAKR